MDADSLRIILAILGGLVIAGLYWWERQRQPDAQEEDRQDDLPDTVEPDTAESDLERREPRLGLDASLDPEEPKVTSTTSQRKPSTDLAQEEEVPPFVAVHLMAKEQPFEGKAIVQAAEQCGLEPGERDIFHCYLGEGPDRQKLFSMANFIKPGSFPFGRMAEFQTSGLILFAELDGSPDDPGRVEELLGTAHSLAEILHGELRDEHRRPLTKAGEKRMRERALALQNPDF